MSLPVLAAFDLGGLIEMGVLALIVLGSIAGQIITRMRGRPEDESEGEIPIGDVEGPPAPAKRARPALPEAKPMAPHPTDQPVPPQPAPSTRPQVERPTPPRRHVEIPRRETPPVQPQRPPGELRVPVTTSAPARPTRPAPRRKPRPPRPRQAPPPETKSLEQRMRGLEEVAISLERGKPIGGDLAAIRHPTRESLRRAIILSEVLGPPISLRTPDDTPWH